MLSDGSAREKVARISQLFMVPSGQRASEQIELGNESGESIKKD